MEYHGKLYGKIGNKYFDTGVTSKDFDKLSQEHKEMLEMLKRIYKAQFDTETSLASLNSIIRSSSKLIEKIESK